MFIASGNYQELVGTNPSQGTFNFFLSTNRPAGSQTSPKVRQIEHGVNNDKEIQGKSLSKWHLGQKIPKIFS